MVGQTGSSRRHFYAGLAILVSQSPAGPRMTRLAVLQGNKAYHHVAEEKSRKSGQDTNLPYMLEAVWSEVPMTKQHGSNQH
jgi:hypothetical protein